MLPIGPLMVEHRLIERMIQTMRKELDRIKGRGAADPFFVETAVDFFRTYADQCHHGKEENILFRELLKKPISKEHSDTMIELVEEHRWSRKTTTALLAAKSNYKQGDEGSLSAIVDHLEFLVAFYPKHMEKEDKQFFMPIMEYFEQAEKDAMLEEVYVFDRQFVHHRYLGVVVEAEKRRQ